VNSLFGDGARVRRALDDGNKELDGKGPKVLTFSSHIVPEEGRDALRLATGHHRFRLFLSKDIPYILGVHAGTRCSAVEAGGSGKATWSTGSSHRRWLGHRCQQMKLNLSEHDVRHTARSCATTATFRAAVS
jgi:hypothetical protein